MENIYVQRNIYETYLDVIYARCGRESADEFSVSELLNINCNCCEKCQRVLSEDRKERSTRFS